MVKELTLSQGKNVLLPTKAHVPGLSSMSSIIVSLIIAAMILFQVRSLFMLRRSENISTEFSNGAKNGTLPYYSVSAWNDPYALRTGTGRY